MIKLSLLRVCASLSIFLLLCSCGSTPRAPVDNRTNKSEKEPASYTQAQSNQQSQQARKDFHIVARGDTLYSIAWGYGLDYKNVARWNNISGNYVIYPGQFIRLKPTQKQPEPLQPGPIVSSKESKPASAKTSKPAPANQTKKTTPITPVSSKKIVWRWPTSGKIVKLNTPSAKKGVNIAGRSGQQIKAAADGEVVYSGSGLLGYGKLIIIKHNETYLSAYAHNESLVAKEGDKVKSGQKIATMGLGQKGQPLLHFEIRKNGSPVNPLSHLPRQKS